MIRPRKNIFLDFLSPENHLLYGTNHNLPGDKQISVLCESLNVAILLCGDHCILPPFFLLQSNVVRKVADVKRIFILSGIVKIPLREAALGDFFEKKMSQYASVKHLYPGLYDSKGHTAVEKFGVSIIKRHASIGDEIASRWQAGPDGNPSWQPLNSILAPSEIEELRDIPQRLKERGESVTWPGMRKHLSRAALRANFQINQILQLEYTRIYLEEFDATIITGAPPKTTEFLLVSKNLSYDYRTFTGVLIALELWDVIRNMTDEEILDLRHKAGFLDFIAVFDDVCGSAPARRAVVHAFARAYDHWRSTTKERVLRRSVPATMSSWFRRSREKIDRVAEMFFHIALCVKRTAENKYRDDNPIIPNVLINVGELNIGPRMEVKMSVFDQRGQRVTYQYNAAGDINLEKIGNRVEFTDQLQKLQREIEKAKEANALSDDAAADADYHLKKAALEAKKSDADKGHLVTYLAAAKDVVENAAAAGGLVLAISKAIEIAQKLF
jgi:hypothetical protein